MDYVKGRKTEPPSSAFAVVQTKSKKLQTKAKKIIVDSIHKPLVAYISDLETSKEMYDKLVGMFKVNNASQILFLKNKLNENRGESIQSYFMRIIEIKNDLLFIGEVTGDWKLSLIALGGLTRECDVFNTTILNNDRIPGFDELLARCTQEEIRMMERVKPSYGNNPTAFSTHFKRRNNVGPRNQGQGFKSGFKGRKGKCFSCNRNNRFNNKGKRNAPAARNGGGCPPKKSRNSRYDEVNVAKQNEFYLISALSTASPPDTLDHWLIDSGASRHFTRYKETLSNLVEKKTNMEIILGDNATYPVKEIGTVTLNLNQGQTFHLQEVLYVLDLKKNVVLIFVMEDKGFKVSFVDEKVRLWQRNLRDAFTLGFRVEGLYQVGGSPLGAMICDTSLQSELWHRRFAHLHFKALPDVRKMVTGMPKFNLNHEGVCQGCETGKHTRGAFPASETQTTDILQLIHSDLSGMFPVTSLDGYLYYAIFVDDFSRKTWIYFLKKKNEVFKWFLSFKALVENQTRKKIKILRTNNRTEYESNEFKDYCREGGIKRETTTAYSPEQNGVAKRKIVLS
eukprot:PITA_16183